MVGSALLDRIGEDPTIPVTAAERIPRRDDRRRRQREQGDARNAWLLQSRVDGVVDRSRATSRSATERSSSARSPRAGPTSATHRRPPMSSPLQPACAPAACGCATSRRTRYALDGDGVGMSLRTPDTVLDCANSGTTMRLLAGVLAGTDFEATLDGDDSLRRRPMRAWSSPLRAMGAERRVVARGHRTAARARRGSCSTA